VSYANALDNTVVPLYSHTFSSPETSDCKEGVTVEEAVYIISVYTLPYNKLPDFYHVVKMIILHKGGFFTPCILRK